MRLNAITAATLAEKSEYSPHERQLRTGIASPGANRSIRRWCIHRVLRGLPAVVSDVGDLGDLVADGVNGYLVPRRSPTQVAAHIVELLKDEKKLAAFSPSARLAALQQETATVVRHWDDIL